MEEINNMEISDFIVGGVYTHLEVNEGFKVTWQRGIAKSNELNSLVLFSKHTSENPYEDKWVGGKLHYTGEGLTGDQSLERGNNKILAESDSIDNIYLFEVLIPKQYIYRGRVALSDEPYAVQEKGANGQIRIAYKFPLTLIDGDSFIDISTLETSRKRKLVSYKKQQNSMSDSDLETMAKNISSVNEQMYSHAEDGNVSSYRTVTTKSYERDLYIAQYVKKIANGICSLCEQPAPFIGKDGEPFLHSHHIEYLSNGGKDVIENCIAVCPNCHAKIHTLEDPKDKQKLLDKVAQR